MILDSSVVQELVPRVDVMFPCRATTDPSTALTRQWYFNDQLLNHDDQTVFVADNGSLVMLLSRDQEDEQLLRAGVYRCHVTNGYSSSEITVKLFIPWAAGCKSTLHSSYSLNFAT